MYVGCSRIGRTPDAIDQFHHRGIFRQAPQIGLLALERTVCGKSARGGALQVSGGDPGIFSTTSRAERRFEQFSQLESRTSRAAMVTLSSPLAKPTKAYRSAPAKSRFLDAISQWPARPKQGARHPAPSSQNCSQSACRSVCSEIRPRRTRMARSVRQPPVSGAPTPGSEQRHR